MKEFFDTLRQKREEKNLTLEELHRRTRLPIAYLQAIENGEMEKIPKGYEKIYLRRYAREVGLDPDEVSRDFDLITGRLTEETDTEASSEQSSPPPMHDDLPPGSEPDPDFRPSSRWRRHLESLDLDRWYKVFWAGFAVVIVAIVGFFSYQQYRFEKGNRIEIREITISEMINELQKQDSLLTPQLSSNTILRAMGQSHLTVALRAIHRTWVREIRDRQDTTEYILPPGIERKIEARDQVKLMLGRADGVEVWFNNQKLEPLGTADQVVLSLVLTPGGVAEKRLKTVVRKPEPVPDTVATRRDFQMRSTEARSDTLQLQ
ncbi:MAG: DUF4115 domain-containing protein [Calditrichaeota bacterium]|nr:DUF4115 domain-containing protein [Calditrichota bacterium]